MNDTMKKLSKRMNRESLTDAERAHMRFVLEEYAALRPARTAAPAHSFVMPFVRGGYALAGLILVVGTSAAVADASQDALPGQSLYGVKVGVVEPLQVALAPTDIAKAELRMSFAENRIDEAAALAKQGALASSTEVALAQSFTANARQAAQDAAQDPASASFSNTTFASELSAYDDVLAKVAQGPSASSTDAMRAAIGARLLALAPPRPALFAAAMDTASGTPDAQTAADVTHLRNASDAALRASSRALAAASTTLGTTTSADARSQLSHVRSLLEEGQARLQAHDDNGAAAAFQDSLSAAARLKVFAHASAALKINAFPDDPARGESATTTAPSGNPVQGSTHRSHHFREGSDD